MIKDLNLHIFAFAIAMAAGSALAGQTAPVNMPVSATVAQSCSLTTTTGVSFGAYTPGQESDAIGIFSIACTAPSSITTLTISAGNGVGHTQGTDTRAMIATSGVNYLSYDLFQDAGHTTVWPAGQSTAVNIPVGTTPVPVQVFGRIRSSLTGIVADSYNDTVNITASF
jgi:spore coat protein U-like protein